MYLTYIQVPTHCRFLFITWEWELSIEQVIVKYRVSGLIQVKQKLRGWVKVNENSDKDVNLTVMVNPTKRESQQEKLERYFLECVS